MIYSISYSPMAQWAIQPDTNILKAFSAQSEEASISQTTAALLLSTIAKLCKGLYLTFHLVSISQWVRCRVPFTPAPAFWGQERSWELLPLLWETFFFRYSLKRWTCDKQSAKHPRFRLKPLQCFLNLFKGHPFLHMMKKCISNAKLTGLL